VLSGTHAGADQAEDQHGDGQQKQTAKLAAALVMPGVAVTDVVMSNLLPGLL
jgi:hypothetical protein